MRLHNQSLPIFALTLIAACSEAKDETPAPKPATDVMQSDSARDRMLDVFQQLNRRVDEG